MLGEVALQYGSAFVNMHMGYATAPLGCVPGGKLTIQVTSATFSQLIHGALTPIDAGRATDCTGCHVNTCVAIATRSSCSSLQLYCQLYCHDFLAVHLIV